MNPRLPDWCIFTGAMLLVGLGMAVVFIISKIGG